jgi:DNA polymerase-3 subunit epsilon
LKLPTHVFLDLETTGATPLKDRITEIALIRYEDGIEVSRWETLVNPDASISTFIQQLTGISNEMVQKAPTFKELAAELLDYLNGAVLCAHNARFDHGFLKNEFKRIGIDLRQKVLCTVKLSRKLYPEHRSHALDAVIARHGLVCSARHRAMGDTEVLALFVADAMRELGQTKVINTFNDLLKGSTLPSGIDTAILDDLPESPGVYLFFGENALPLYIGKSINIRARVMSHFSSDHASTKEMRIGQEVKHVEWIETAGEFTALLLESRLVKERQPIYNRQLRRARQLCSWRIASSSESKPLVNLVREDEFDPSTIGQLFGTFRTKRQATEVLRQIVDTHNLCAKTIGLETGSGACFGHQLKRCLGVCVGKEKPEIHYLRLQQALASHRLKSWPYDGPIGIRESDSLSAKTAVHVFQNWCHIGTVNEESELHQLMNSRSAQTFDLDTYKLLIKELGKANTQVIKFGASISLITDD